MKTSIHRNLNNILCLEFIRLRFLFFLGYVDGSIFKTFPAILSRICQDKVKQKLMQRNY